MDRPDRPERAPRSARERGPSGSAWAYAVAGALILGIIAFTAGFVSHARQDGIDDRRRELANLAQTLAEHSARVFESLDLIEDGLIDQLEEEGVDRPSQLRTVMGTQTMHVVMREKIIPFPHVDAIGIVDTDGRLLNSSRDWPPPQVNLADRGYFRALASMKGPPSFISEPMRSRTTDAVIIYLARRIATREGRFLGVTLGALEQSVFERFYAAVKLGSDGMIALVRDDGALLARAPASAGPQVPDPAMRARLAAAVFSPSESGNLPAGALDEKPRLAAVQKVARLPLAVVASDSWSAVDTLLMQRAMPQMLAAALLCCAIAVIGYGVAQHLAREHAFAAAQHAMARLDPLTGLPNRLAFTETLEARLKAPMPEPLALLFLDLDGFKAVNDTLGHDAGDAMLVEMSARISACLGPRDMVARFGGDEFAVVRTQPRDASPDNVAALAFADGLLAALHAPFELGHHRIVGGGSAGVALAPRDGASLVQLMKNADLALYRAKSEGRGVARLFEEAMERRARQRRQLELDLLQAWRAAQFFLVYQPIFEATSGRLAGFEALARWQHPERGLIHPDAFIPLAEETGLIVPLGAWVLAEACRAAATWPDDLFISVNLSPVQFRNGQAPAQVKAALEASGLPPHRLEVEITESILLSPEATVRGALERFQAEGITVSLDDFGTGYSSLAYLRTLSIGRIKIAQSFVEEVERSPQSVAIVRAIVSLARTLGLGCTAEGIETEGQRRIMVAEGCTHLQGFLLGRPAPPEVALRLARTAAA
ncbi:EAL domain-containing protein [Xanthobacter sp. V3C-3]|uniref:putative bifunctional diguanylate cyclase/phosphodiesterase n=1 Tax=Xanthobacter lutulentifluminis TaxID=3119935 RepID=UPI003727C7A0